MAHEENIYHCYFRRQPSTPRELEQAVQAVCVSCCGAVRYAGTDQGILNRFIEVGYTEGCDVLNPPA
jgi:hypothetical protein